jgi:superfamily I DNA/RNA helicase
MSTWLVPQNDLTPEQLRAVHLNPEEHRVIMGPPGSGKTLILLHRARHLLDLWHVPPDRFRIFVFTKALKEYIRSSLSLLDLPDDCVTNFDAWCKNFHRTHIRDRLPHVGRELDFPGIRRRVLTEIRGNLFAAPKYDFVLVDEGQDLDSTAFDIIRAISNHVTVCIDHKQQIYDIGSSETDILQRMGLIRRNLELLGAFRCCPFIVSLASELLSDPGERQAFINQARTAQTERERPLLYLAPDFEHEKGRLIEILRVRQSKGEKVAILLPQKRQVFGFAKGIREAGLEIETPEKMDFQNDIPKIMPYHSAKGLTFDTVLLPRLVRSSFPRISDSRIMKLLFVGITRASKWVYMSSRQEGVIPALETLMPLERTNVLTIQRGAGPAIQPPAVETPGSTETDDILDLI